MKKVTSILNSITDTNLVLLFHYLIILFLIIGFYACNKTEVNWTPPPPPSPRDTTTIYIAGSSVSATTLLSVATVWINGNPVNISNNSNDFASGIFVTR
ncbi:MAG TPA: hypothetical protein VK711_14095 [Puia sp.]|nr:hypothetical protein [Puia sp.]